VLVEVFCVDYIGTEVFRKNLVYFPVADLLCRVAYLTIYLKKLELAVSESQIKALVCAEARKLEQSCLVQIGENLIRMAFGREVPQLFGSFQL